MADAAVDFLLNNLKDLLIDHFKLITDTKGHIVTLETDLRKFKAFLKDSVKERRKNEGTKALVRSIRDVVYEVEDIIDAFITHAIEEKAKSKLFHGFWRSARQLHDIGQLVKDVNERVKKASEELANHKGGDETKPEKPKYQVREAREKNVVGFKDVTEKLIARLTKETSDLDVVSLTGSLPEETSNLDVVALTGMFGLGKTTLAWKIFKDERIVYRFPYRKWLTISQELSRKDVFLSILKDFAANTEDLDSRMELELAGMVAECLQDKSFLIVLDDVWSERDWELLEAALPKSSRMGKVLVTSREDSVGTRASRPRLPEKLRFFNRDESWELLRLEALGKLDCPPELVSVGKRIANSCGGLPLALVVIGGILATKFSQDKSAMKREWERVAERVNTYLIDGTSTETRMKNFISLSYDRLPYHLRSCFLYFGMFPEDYEIPVSKLISMWIAEGFIQQEKSCSLEETAEVYLADLINRNLVQIKKFKTDGKVKTCAIHDALRDFCRSEAEQEHENFLREIKFIEGVFNPPADELKNYRRLSIHSKCSEFVCSKPFGPRVRSFVSFPKKEDEFTLEDKNIPNILAAFKLVRVMDIKSMTLSKLTKEMYQLFHLRYMAFSLELSRLPAKFSNLWNIQTLVVVTTSNKLDVEADIWNMKNLRHFKTNASATLPKPNKDSKYGAELQTLGTVSVESCTTSILERACNLKKLGIRGKLALLMDEKNEFFNRMGKMNYLEKLKLINDLDGRPASDGTLRSLPQAYQFPTKLKSLTLEATFLNWKEMSVLGLLENLVVLKLKTNAFSGKTWSLTEGDTGFPLLEFLLIEHTDLEVWNATSPRRHFSALKGLVLKNCEKLFEIPLDLADVESFRMLELYFCEHAADSALTIEAKKGKEAKGSTFKASIFPQIKKSN